LYVDVLGHSHFAQLRSEAVSLSLVTPKQFKRRRNRKRWMSKGEAETNGRRKYFTKAQPKRKRKQGTAHSEEGPERDQLTRKMAKMRSADEK
jgi:hypothetical protein